MNIQKILDHRYEAAKLLKIMASERRLMIICALYKGEKSVGELEQLLDLSQSALSQHLAKLRREKIVKTRRNAQTIYYSLNDKRTTDVLCCLDKLYSNAECC